MLDMDSYHATYHTTYIASQHGTYTHCTHTHTGIRTACARRHTTAHTHHVRVCITPPMYVPHRLPPLSVLPSAQLPEVFGRLGREGWGGG